MQTLSSQVLLKRLTLLSILFIFNNPVFADDLNDGKAAYQQQDYETALNAFTKAANNDNAEAQWLLGKMLFKGQGTTEDKIAAYSWLTLASDKDFAQATEDKAKVKPFLSSVDLVLADTLTKGFKQKHKTENIINKQPAVTPDNPPVAITERSTQQTAPAPKPRKVVVIEDKSSQFISLELKAQENSNDLVAVEKEEVLLETPPVAKQQMPVEIEEKSTKVIIKDANDKATQTTQNLQVKLAKPVPVKAEQTPREQLTTITAENKAKPAKTTQNKTANYRVQVGAYSEKVMAKKALANITKKLPKTIAKYGSVITEPNTKSTTHRLHKLQLGSFIKRSDADGLCKQLKQRKQPCFVVTTGK